MIFPLTLMDLELLFSITALILLITSGLLSSDYHGFTVLLSTKRLKNLAALFSGLFMAIVVLQIFNIVGH